MCVGAAKDEITPVLRGFTRGPISEPRWSKIQTPWGFDQGFCLRGYQELNLVPHPYQGRLWCKWLLSDVKLRSSQRTCSYETLVAVSGRRGTSWFTTVADTRSPEVDISRLV